MNVVNTVALIGNPNTGKSTLFGELVGSLQRVGNYPGVTVEKKIGRTICDGRSYDVIDLPGLYSLSPRSRDEMVAVDLLLGRYDDTSPVDIVICVLDAGNLDRNLYLLSQVLELGLPTIVALNKLDVAEGLGLSLDVEGLACRLGVPVICTQANRGQGTGQLKAALGQSLGRPAAAPRGLFPQAFEDEVSGIENYFAARAKTDSSKSRPPRWLVERLLLDKSGYIKDSLFPTVNKNDNENVGLDNLLEEARDRLAAAKCRVPKIETTSRYAWSRTVLEDVLDRPDRYRVSTSDRIDRVLTHRVWGTAIFAVVMLSVFQSVFNGARPIMAIVERGSATVGQLVETHMAEGAMRSLLVNGMVGGVGAVVGFLPQILILFMFIAILEDCGYMSRAAFLMDRLMSRVGLSGRSFIPMLSSFACAVPGIMATRVISNDRDRLTTILVAPLMTCSARLPIYTLLIAAFIPAGGEHSIMGGWLNLQGLTLAGLYLLGIVTAVTAALVFKKTILRGQSSSFFMELPDYKWPSPAIVLHRVLERNEQSPSRAPA
ncbi:MAG: ferrous iron transport protein B, partial [Planctomycetota bacterium]|nr:ferrous iron transport protein B [Planctomycetota bacterium]